MKVLSLPNGVHHGIAPADYHGLPGCSKSMLDKLRLSPATLRDWLDNPEAEEKKDSLTLGSAIHCAVLEPDQFAKRFAVAPDVSGATKEGKAFKVAAESKGLTVVRAGDARWIEAIARRVRANKTVKDWLADTTRCIELTVIWERDGFVCRARPDLVLPLNGLVVDLKTTRKTMEDFPSDIAQYRLHWQAAWYLDGLEAATKTPWDRFVFIAAHKARPYLVSLHEIVRGDKAFVRGQREVGEMFDRYVECCKSQRWPGYPEEAQPVVLPKWAVGSADETDNDAAGWSGGDESFDSI